MKEFMMIPRGFAGLPTDEEFVTTAQNKKNYAIAVQDWNYGPEMPTNEPGANKEFYVGLAEAMQCDAKDARRKHCSNCEYYDNSTLTQAKMDKIPWNAWDVDAGFRGYCRKFDFICHDLRSCQAWEERDFEMD